MLVVVVPNISSVSLFKKILVSTYISLCVAIYRKCMVRIRNAANALWVWIGSARNGAEKAAKRQTKDSRLLYSTALVFIQNENYFNITFEYSHFKFFYSFSSFVVFFFKDLTFICCYYFAFALLFLSILQYVYFLFFILIFFQWREINKNCFFFFLIYTYWVYYAHIE